MVEIRPVETDSEHEVALALNNEVAPDHAITMAEVRSMLEAMPEQRHWLAWDGRTAVGTASGIREQGYRLPRCRNLVTPERRRQGIGTALYAALSDWARELGVEEVEAFVAEGSDGEEFARSRGFREVSRESKLVLELAGLEPPDVRAPDGVEIVTWAERPELAPGMYEVYAEAAPDIPGNEEQQLEGIEVWLRNEMGGSGDRPEATFVAVAGDEVVGYSKFSLTDAQPTVAHHDLTGVRRSWRGRGVAGALKAAQIRWAIEQGYERLQTSNEERNAPIRALNERYGYRVSPGRIRFRGPLSGAPT